MITADGYKRDELVREGLELLLEYDYDGANAYDVGLIMDKWWSNKEPLVRLFEKHPKYNGNYQIVFPVTMDRPIGTDKLYEFRSWIIDVIKEKLQNDIELRKLWWNVEDVIVNPYKFINEDEATALNEAFDKFGAKDGQKRSRVVNKMCKLFGVSEHAEFNGNFARYADAVNPLQITRITVISVNPIDYWTMSFGNSWASCHSIDKQNKRRRGGQHYNGCYSSGTESYMLDPSSIVLYTVDGDYHGTRYELEDKINRNMFHLGEDFIVQGRVYPQANDGALDVYKMFREIMQKVYADCKSEPNLWVNRKGTEECGSVIETRGTHYRDYLCYGDCNVSYMKGKDNSTVTRIRVGHNPICPCCGCEHENEENICCPDCSGQTYTCNCCGEIIRDEEDVCWVDGEPYCRDCVTWDDYADEYTTDECVEVHRYGTVSVWNAEHNDCFYQCAHCGEWYYETHNGVFVESSGNWYCDDDCAMSDGNVYAGDIEEWIPEDEALRTGDGEIWGSEEALFDAGYTELMDDGLYYTPEEAARIRGEVVA